MLVRRRHQHRPTPRSRRKQKVKPADPPNPLEEAPGKQPRSQAQSSLASPQRAAPQQARQVRLPQTRSRRDSLPGAVIPLSGLGQDIVYNDDRPSKDVSPVDSRDCDLLRDLISSKFDQVITSIDGETFTGEEEDLVIHEEPRVGVRGGWGSRNRSAISKSADRAITSAVLSTNYFAKASLYANSRLPSNLPPLRLCIPAWPLVCLAAQYSQRAYHRPMGEEREAFVNADWRMGTKAMMIKSVPMDDMNCMVFAIRGSQTFMDWAVNINSAPVSPGDFLDDPGNLCHQGFLSVARKMIKPVATRLRSLLEEDPWRSTFSLLMTGHSAGGAVASLLYAHMLAEDVKSELNVLTGCFKRIHCLTFGTPPISLLPLTKPPISRHKRSLFMSFINEGDPVPRADKAYVRSLLYLYASPAPGLSRIGPLAQLPAPKYCHRRKAKRAATAPSNITVPPQWSYKWNVPPGTLSNAGRLVVLRELNSNRPKSAGEIKADITCDQQLREVVFGDPVMHMMSVYARRVEVLATKAVTAKFWS